jgi:predicted RNase H-like nuclease
MSSNITQLDDYYKTPKEVSEALKVKDLQTLIRGIRELLQLNLSVQLTFFLKGLSKLRTQLTIAIKNRVDPTEKYTKPLVEYCQ